MATPALFTSTSSRPAPFTTSSTAAAQAAVSDTSNFMLRALGPLAATASAAATSLPA
jgi:hypothetical protein